MANIYLCHPDGADNNGGGYFQGDNATYANCQSSFAPVDIVTGASISDNGGGLVRITSVGGFTNTVTGIIAYIAFTDEVTYTSGRYVVLDRDDNWIDITETYVSVTTVTVRVGGAIFSPDEAVALAYSDSGDQLLFPANQTIQTENEVDGSNNSITCITELYTLDMFGVDEDTGELLEFDDLWPVIKAKSGSTWDTNTIMLFMQDGIGSGTSDDCYFNVDKIIFDGNELVPIIIKLGDYSGDYIYTTCGDFEIKNALGGKSGEGVGLEQVAYLSGYYDRDWHINTLKISNCGQGLITGSRTIPPIRGYLWIDNCGIGYDAEYAYPYILYWTKLMILSNNDIGMHSHRYGGDIKQKILCVNNTIDISLEKYSTTNTNYIFNYSLFYNDADNGAVIVVDDANQITVTLDNCIYGATGSGGTIFDGFTPIERSCQEITANPFMNKDEGDYRLDPNFEDLFKIWDWESWINNIGVTSPAEPSGSGGGTVSSGGSVIVVMD